MVRQPGHERDLERLLAQRRVHDLPGAPVVRDAIRRAPRAHGRRDRLRISPAGDRGCEGRGSAAGFLAAARPGRSRSGRGHVGCRLREGSLVPGLPRGALRAACLRCLPARLLRRPCLPEHGHGGLPELPARRARASRRAGDPGHRNRRVAVRHRHAGHDAADTGRRVRRRRSCRRRMARGAAGNRGTARARLGAAGMGAIPGRPARRSRRRTVGTVARAVQARRRRQCRDCAQLAGAGRAHRL